MAVKVSAMAAAGGALAKPAPQIEVSSSTNHKCSFNLIIEKIISWFNFNYFYNKYKLVLCIDVESNKEFLELSYCPNNNVQRLRARLCYYKI